MTLPPPEAGDRPRPNDGAELATAFARLLRRAGLDVPASCTIGFAEALGVLGVTDREATYWAGRSTLIRRPEDLELYDRAFAAFWERVVTTVDADTVDDRLDITLAVDTDDGEDEPGSGGEASDDPVLELRFSSVETLRHKDFADYSPAELDEARELMSKLRLVSSPRRSLRLAGAKSATRHPDLRRTVRAAMRSGGEPIRRHYRKPDTRSRRLVLLVDISGSMEPYARALLRFVHAAVAGRQKVEAFALGTRLTRLTRELSGRDPDEALSRAAQRMADYGGGTRLGDGLAAFNGEWGQRGMARGATVVILSDGWDRGDPELLAEQMQRLHRAAHAVIWVNPLKVTPGYAPLARGMAAALPHVDAFVEGHSLAAIEELAERITDPHGNNRARSASR